MATPRQFFPWGVGNPTFYLVTLAGVDLMAMTFLAITGSAAAAITTGIAAFMAGGILGFLFGIPRYAASTADRQIHEAERSGIVKYHANTNLEQISDWLTKILVGLGLTQFKEIGRFFNSVTEDVGKALAGADSSLGNVEAAGLLVLALSTGFLFFYLWSRVYLPRMFQRAEQEG